MTTSFTSYPFPATGASASRTMPDRLLDVVNVRDYGAVGNGVTDDWEAIMAALSWNSIFVQAAATVYSAAIRFTALSWAAGTATAVTAAAHGLTAGDQIVHHFTTQTDGAEWTGVFTVTTVLDSTSFTYPVASRPGPAAVPVGCFTAKVTSATWSGNVVTVDFGAPHRMISGITVSVFGFSTGIDVVSHVVTVTSPTRLTFPFTGSGSLSIDPLAWVSAPGKLVVTSWPGVPDFFYTSIYGYYMAQEYMGPGQPAHNYAGFYRSQIFDVTGTAPATITFGIPFFPHNIQAGAAVRLHTTAFGKIYFPPGDYYVSKQLSLQYSGVSGIFYGSPGNSIIRGSFPNYLLAQTQLGAGPSRYEGLTFINDDPGGGGLRLVAACAFVTACTFKCGDIGLTLSNQDFRNAVGFGVEVTGCIFLPNGSASIGLSDASNNSEICGNGFYGLANGMFAQNFFHCTDGNSFVDCEIGYNGGTNPFGEQGVANKTLMRGNAFSNCGIGLFARNSGINRTEGIFIAGGADAEYGLKMDNLGIATMRGLYATGDFSVAAIQALQSGTPPHNNNRVVLRSVGAANTGAGDVWVPLTINSQSLDNCNALPVYSYSGIRGRAIIGSPSYNSGTGVVTLTTDSTHYLTGYTVLISGVKVSGSTANSYNGIFYPLTQAEGSSIVTYQVGVPPGTADADTGGICSAGVSQKNCPIKAILWSSGTVSVETLGPHGLVNYGTVWVQAVVGGNYSNGYNNIFVVTVIDDTHFTYAVASNPGTVDPPSLSTSLPSKTSELDGAISYCAPIIDKYNPSRDVEEGYSTVNISNGQKFGGGIANIGDRVEGGGSQHISVIWTNQNAWVRRG